MRMLKVEDILTFFHDVEVAGDKHTRRVVLVERIRCRDVTTVITVVEMAKSKDPAWRIDNAGRVRRMEHAVRLLVVFERLLLPVLVTFPTLASLVKALYLYTCTIWDDATAAGGSFGKKATDFCNKLFDYINKADTVGAKNCRDEEARGAEEDEENSLCNYIDNVCIAAVEEYPSKEEYTAEEYPAEDEYLEDDEYPEEDEYLEEDPEAQAPDAEVDLQEDQAAPDGKPTEEKDLDEEDVRALARHLVKEVTALLNEEVTVGQRQSQGQRQRQSQGPRPRPRPRRTRF